MKFSKLIDLAMILPIAFGLGSCEERSIEDFCKIGEYDKYKTRVWVTAGRRYTSIQSNLLYNGFHRNYIFTREENNSEASQKIKPYVPQEHELGKYITPDSLDHIFDNIKENGCDCEE